MTTGFSPAKKMHSRTTCCLLTGQIKVKGMNADSGLSCVDGLFPNVDDAGPTYLIYVL